MTLQRISQKKTEKKKVPEHFFNSMDANEVAVALAAVAFVGLSFGTWRQAKIATTLVEKEYEVCGWLARILL